MVLCARIGWNCTILWLVLKRNIFCQCIITFTSTIIPPWKKGLISDPSFKQNRIEVYSLPQIFFMPSLVKIVLVGLVVQDKKFKMFVMYLHLLYYLFTNPCRRSPVFDEYLNSLYSRMLCAICGWNWPNCWFCSSRKFEMFSSMTTPTVTSIDRQNQLTFHSGDLKRI